MAILEVKKAEIQNNFGPYQDGPSLKISFVGKDDDGNRIPPAHVSIDAGKWLIVRMPGYVWIGERYADIFPDDVPPVIYQQQQFRGLTKQPVVVACARAFLEWLETAASTVPAGVIYERGSGFQDPFKSYNSRL